VYHRREKKSGVCLVDATLTGDTSRSQAASRVGQVVPTDRCKAGEQNLQENQSPRGSARVFCASVGIWHEVGQLCCVAAVVDSESADRHATPPP
jgi:hypothetical protein